MSLLKSHRPAPGSQCPEDAEKHLAQRKEISHTIIVDNGSDQLVLLEHGEMLKGSGFAEDITALQAMTSCNQIIHLDSHPVIR